jgi:hypothetical protein
MLEEAEVWRAWEMNAGQRGIDNGSKGMRERMIGGKRRQNG